MTNAKKSWMAVVAGTQSCEATWNAASGASPKTLSTRACARGMIPLPHCLHPSTPGPAR
jgi:hypothetical protein